MIYFCLQLTPAARQEILQLKNILTINYKTKSDHSLATFNAETMSTKDKDAVG